MFSENLSSSALHEKLLSLACEERKLTLELLRHLREFDRRKLYAERGHASLFGYVVEELKYSESAAQRRIFAMRALRDLPELEAKVESGELKVTQLAQVQSFIRAEAKDGKRLTREERKELIESTVGKSARETEKLLVEKNPEVARRERIHLVTPTLTQITFTADDALMVELAAVRDRFAHRLPVGATTADVIRFLAEYALRSTPEAKTKASTELAESATLRSEKPIEGSGRSNQTQPPDPPAGLDPLPASVVASRYVPVAVRNEVWARDRGACTYVSEETGRRCGSRHRLEVDHVRPYALGGRSDDAANLRILCFTHNQAEARRWFVS